MNRLYTYLIVGRERLAVVVGASAWAAPLTALAALENNVQQGGIGPSDTAFAKFRSVDTAIQQIFNIVITVAGVAFVVLFLIGGIQYLSSAGNEDTTKKARQLMLDAVIGLGIVVGAWAIGTYALFVLGLAKTSGTVDLDPNIVK